MLKLTKKKAAFAGLLATSALAVLPALAQDRNGAARQGVLSLSFGLEAGRNTDLKPGGDDFSAELRGRIGYDYTMTTSTSALHFGVSTNPKISDADGTRPLPKAVLDFTQRTARSELSFGAQYTRTEVTDQSIGYDETGSVLYYDSTGERALSRITAGFTGGIDAPFGYSVSLSHSELDYYDTDPGSYYASRQTRAQLDLRAALSAATALSFSVAHQAYEADNSDRLERRKDSVLVALSQRLDTITRLDFSIGRSRLKSERLSGTEIEEGTTLGLTLAREDARGRYTLAFDRSITETGARDQLTLAREGETALGTFSGMLGLSRGDADQTDVIAGLGYAVKLPSNTLELDLSRAVRTNDDGEDVVQTRVSGALSHELNEISALNFGLMASVTEQASYDTTRVNASVAYSHDLGADADISAGVKMALSHRSGREDADSQTFFVTLSRRFETLR